MQLSFSDDEERGAAKARESLVEAFATWLRTRPEHAGVDPIDVDLILGWKWAYADGDYGWWTRDHVDEVLLEHLPRKLSASLEEVASIPRSLGAFVHFLAERGWLSEGSDGPVEVALRAVAQERSFLDAMGDPANFGMAKRLVDSGHFDVGEDAGPGDIQAAMDNFNSLPFEERDRILRLPDDGLVGPPGVVGLGPPSGGLLPDGTSMPLPFWPLPPVSELDGAASEVPLLAQVEALHDALGPKGIKLTKAGNPTLADGRRLAAALGEPWPDRARSTTEVPHLAGPLRVAIAAGAVDMDEDAGRMRAGAAWSALRPGARWAATVEGLLKVGAASLWFGLQQPMPMQMAEAADMAAVLSLGMAWAAGEPLPKEAFVSLLLEMGLGGPVTGFMRILGEEAVREIGQQRAEDVWRSLVAARIIEGQDEELELTLVGARLVQPVLALAGFTTLLPEDLIGADAGEFLDRLVESGADPEEVGGALAGEGPSPAGVIDALTLRPEPVRVMTGFAYLGGFGAAAVPPVRAALPGPLGPHAWMFLVEQGEVAIEDVPRDAFIRVGIDLLLATAESGSPADVIEALLGHVPLEEHGEFIDELAQSDNPRTADLLERIGGHHPVKPVAKHARKAAHRWRSKHGVSRS